tara:strand:+ start:26083 stop:28089 length:2007 start_codon:yes stop_codon:yes gene_type:complete
MAITDNQSYNQAINNSILQTIYPNRKEREKTLTESFEKSKKRRIGIEKEIQASEEGKNYDDDGLRQKSLELLKKEEIELMNSKVDNLSSQYLTVDYMKMLRTKGKDPANDPLIKGIFDDYERQKNLLNNKNKLSKKELEEIEENFENFISKELNKRLYKEEYSQEAEKFFAFYNKETKNKLVETLSADEKRLFNKQPKELQNKTISLYRGLEDVSKPKDFNLSFSDVVKGTMKGVGAAGWLLHPHSKAAFLIVSTLNKKGVFDPLKNKFKNSFNKFKKQLAESNNPKMAKFGKFFLGAAGILAVSGGIAAGIISGDEIIDIGKNLLSGVDLEAAMPSEVQNSVTGENLSENIGNGVVEEATVNEPESQMDKKVDDLKERVENTKETWANMTPEEKAEAKANFENNNTDQNEANTQPSEESPKETNNTKPEEISVSQENFTSREFIQQSIVDANDQIVDPDKIYAGDTINIPTSNGNFIEYEIQKGDTLSEISERFAVSQELVQGNDLSLIESENDYFEQAEKVDDFKTEYLANNVFDSDHGQDLMEKYEIKSTQDFSEFLQNYNDLSVQEQKDVAPFMDELAKKYPEYIDSSYVKVGEPIKHSIEYNGLISHIENQAQESALNKNELNEMAQNFGNSENPFGDLEQQQEDKLAVEENKKQVSRKSKLS